MGFATSIELCTAVAGLRLAPELAGLNWTCVVHGGCGAVVAAMWRHPIPSPVSNRC